MAKTTESIRTVLRAPTRFNQRTSKKHRVEGLWCWWHSNREGPSGERTGELQRNPFATLPQTKKEKKERGWKEGEASGEAKGGESQGRLFLPRQKKTVTTRKGRLWARRQKENKGGQGAKKKLTVGKKYQFRPGTRGEGESYTQWGDEISRHQKH